MFSLLRRKISGTLKWESDLKANWNISQGQSIVDEISHQETVAT